MVLVVPSSPHSTQQAPPCKKRQPLPWLALTVILLQRSPMLFKAGLTRQLAQLPFAQVARWVPAALATGGLHAITGATGGTVTPLSPSANPSETRVGESFIWAFRTTGGNKAKSYSIQGLPTGLKHSGEVKAGVSSISGTPEEHGDFSVAIIGWENPGQRGPSTDTYFLNLIILPKEGQGTFRDWAEINGLQDANAASLADPDNDGSSNLIEYAFHFDPRKPNPNQGPTTDLAPVSTPQILSKTKTQLEIAYIRRKQRSGTDVIYTLESSQDLVLWAPVAGEEQVTDLDSNWEGIVHVISDPNSYEYLRMRVTNK